MERSKAQLLELTRCGMWGGEPDTSLFEEGVEWDTVLKLTKEQTLWGVVSVAIERLPSTLIPSRATMLRLHQMVSLNRAYRRHHIEVLGKLLDMMREIGVERPVLLKGLGVGLNYKDPSLRQCGDIDLYVGEKHYQRVWDFVCTEFNITKEDNHSDQHFDFDFMETHIEIHQYATSPSSVAFRRDEFMEWCSSQLEGDTLREVSIEGVKVLLPPHNFDFIFIFYHTWRHFLTGGIGLRQMCDWCCYIDRFSQEVDHEEVQRLVTLFRLKTPISLFATIAVEELGLDGSKIAKYATTPKEIHHQTLERIWSGGNFGFYRAERKTRSQTVLQRKWQSLLSQLSDLRFIWRIDWRYAMAFYPSFFASNIREAIRGFDKLGDKL